MSDQELKPCPILYCQSLSLTIHKVDDGHYVECDQCSLETGTSSGDGSRENAIRQWNSILRIDNTDQLTDLQKQVMAEIHEIDLNKFEYCAMSDPWLITADDDIYTIQIHRKPKEPIWKVEDKAMANGGECEILCISEGTAFVKWINGPGVCTVSVRNLKPYNEKETTNE